MEKNIADEVWRDIPVHTMKPERKRGTSEDMTDELSDQRRQKRLHQNREQAACLRARKQGYIDELMDKVSRLEKETEILRIEKRLEEMLICSPKIQLRRVASGPL